MSEGQTTKGTRLKMKGKCQTEFASQDGNIVQKRANILKSKDF